MDSKTLALYLGCQVKGTEGTMIYKLTGVTNDGGVLLQDSSGFSCDLGTDFKPILRPLSSMTEEEVKEYLRMKYNAVKELTVEKNENGFWFTFGLAMPDLMSGNRKFIFEKQIADDAYPEQFVWLLSKGFDLFGLIEKGEAVSMG